VSARGWGMAAAALAVATAACSPELDWREVRSEPGRFVAVLPGKPRLEERQLYGRPGMVMHLWSARAGEALYGVGYADAPRADASLVPSTRDALTANIGGRLVSDREIVVGTARGREFTAEGPKVTLMARVLLADHRLYQVALVAKKGEVDSAAADTFFSSFRLAAPQ